MKNFVFISPNFPETYWHFCAELKKVGFRVLGVGDQPYDQLLPELREALDEYYKVNNLDNFDEEKEAVGYFERKYGHIDYLESNNEYWLRKDSILRDLFSIDTGLHSIELDDYQRKSLMKKHFEDAGVKVAPYILVKDKKSLVEFAEKYGFPLFVKPDIGVGAEESFKLKNMEELEEFFEKKSKNCQFICETFVTGDIVTFDGIADENSEAVYCASLECPPSISDILQAGDEMFYYCNPWLDPKFEKLGRATIKAFNLKNRFFHIEYFRVTKARKGLFKVGDIVGLEVNIRCPGGYTPDMHNYANSFSCYQLYAENMAGLKPQLGERKKYYAPTASRRDGVEYFYSDEEVLRTYKDNIVGYGRYPGVLSGVMGNIFFMARFENLDDVKVFREYVNRKPGYHSASSSDKGTMFNKKDSGGAICDTHIDGA